MTRDEVIKCAKAWVSLLPGDNFKGSQEEYDVLNACIDLAYHRTKEALTAYSKERDEQFKAHERMLETIEQTLKEEFIHGD